MARRTSTLNVRSSIQSFPSVAISMGRANSFQGISSLFGKLADDFSQQADKEAIATGTEEGRLAGVTGTPELREAGTLEADAFNTAARQSFANKSELSIRNNLNRIAVENPADPTGYANAAGGYLSGMVNEISQVDPALAELVDEKFKLDIASDTQAISKVHSSLKADQFQADAITLNNQINIDLRKIVPGLISGDPEKGQEAVERIGIEKKRLITVLNGTGENGLPLFDQASITQALIDFDQNVFQEIARGWVQGQPDKVIAMEAIESGVATMPVTEFDENGEPLPTKQVSITENMTPENLEALKGFATKQVTNENRAKQRALQASASEVADLEIGIDNGTMDLDDIQDAEDKGLFEGREQKRATLTKNWQSIQEAKKAGQISITRVTDAINGEVLLDPNNKDDKKSVDAYWQTVENQILANDQMTDAQKITANKTAATNLVQRTGIIPKTMKGQIVGAMRSGTTDQRISAADMIDRLNQLPGNVLVDEMTKSDIALGLQISSLVKAGQTPEQAVESAITATDPTNKPVIEAREQTIKTEKFVDGYEDIVTDHFNPTSILDFVPFGPDDDAILTTVDGTKSRVIADYKVLFEDWFTRTGDQDTAEEQALKDLGRVWGVTRVDGQVRVMKYAPEAFYGVGENDAEWMSTQLQADIETIKPGIDPESIMLGSDNRTARQAKTRRPTYPVLIKGKSGAFEPLRLDGDLIRWSPDNAETKRKGIVNKIKDAKQRRQDKIRNDRLGPVNLRLPNAIDIDEGA